MILNVAYMGIIVNKQEMKALKTPCFDTALNKGDGRNFSLQTKGYVCNVINFMFIIYHVCDVVSTHLNPEIKTFTNLTYCKRIQHPQAFINFSKASNFCSNTLHASSIGPGVVISTPAFFKISIG